MSHTPKTPQSDPNNPFESVSRALTETPPQIQLDKVIRQFLTPTGLQRFGHANGRFQVLFF